MKYRFHDFIIFDLDKSESDLGAGVKNKHSNYTEIVKLFAKVSLLM